jgi:Mce-associated membrane protein
VNAEETSQVDDVQTAVEKAEDTTAAGDKAAAPKVRPTKDRVRSARLAGWRRRLPAILLALLTLASAALAGALFYIEYRPDHQTDASVASAAVKAASDGTIAILSYSPDTLESDFSSAKSHLTGDFLSYYDQFTRQIVLPAAKQKAVKTTASVVRAAVSDLHPDKATVLVYINQTTTSSDKPEPTLTASSVLVTIAKVKDGWLISSFDPV